MDIYTRNIKIKSRKQEKTLFESGYSSTRYIYLK